MTLTLKPSRLSLTVSSLFVVLGASPAWSQSTPPTIKAPTVVVTTGTSEKALQNVGFSVSVITAEEIQNSPATVVGDLLKKVPGLEITNTGSQGLLRVAIRGEWSRETMVLIDGQKVIDQKSADGIPLTIDPSNIERIEVIKGPASVLYGTDGIGGVINIITKKADTSRAFTALVSAGADSGNHGYNGSASIGGKAGRFNYHINAAKVHAGDIHTKINPMKGTNFATESVNAHLGFALTDHLNVGVAGEYFDMEFSSAYYRDEVNATVFNVWVPVVSRKKAAVFIDWKEPFAKLKRARFDAFSQKLVKEMASTGPMNVKNLHDQYGMTLQTDWQFTDSLSMIAGYVYNFEQLEANKPADWNYIKGNFHNHAVYASADWWMTDQWVLNYGLRFNRDSVALKMGNRNHYSSNHWLHQASAMYHITPALVVRALWSQGMKTPRIKRVKNQLGYNEKLHPITSDNFELGLRWKNAAWSVDTALFHTITDFEDERAKATGMEASASYTFEATGLEPYIALSWLYRQYGAKDDLHKELMYPQATCTYGLRWKKTLADIQWRVDTWGYSRTHDDTDTGWTIFNATVGADFGAKQQYSVNLGLHNIGDKLYKRGNRAIYQPGRHITVKFNAKF